MSRYQFFFRHALACCFFFFFISKEHANAQRTFRNKASNAPGCSRKTALSGSNCPCLLNGQKCNGDGLRCINNLCKCAPGFLTVTESGRQRCLPAFYVIPTIQVPDNSLYGPVVPCGLSDSLGIPGYNLTFINAQKPVYCTKDTLYITREDADNPADKDTVLGPGVSYVDIDQYTGEIVPMTVVNAPDGVGTYLTETYTGYCVDSRGISSNIFSFKVTFTKCP